MTMLSSARSPPMPCAATGMFQQGVIWRLMLAASTEGLICATCAGAWLARAAGLVAGALAVALLRRLDPLGRLLDAAQQRVEVAVGLLGRRRRRRLVGLGLGLGDLRRLLGLGLGRLGRLRRRRLGRLRLGRRRRLGLGLLRRWRHRLGHLRLGWRRRRRRWLRRRLRDLGRRRWRRRFGAWARAWARPSGPAAVAPGSRPARGGAGASRLAAPWAAGAKAWAGRSRSRSRPRSVSRPGGTSRVNSANRTTRAARPRWRMAETTRERPMPARSLNQARAGGRARIGSWCRRRRRSRRGASR